jgi:hypothetical protein
MTDLVYNLADLMQLAFKPLEMLGNIPNTLFVILGFIGAGFWLFKQSQYSKRDKRAGKLV